jgi:P-type Ca2+ transporter type 2C
MHIWYMILISWLLPLTFAEILTHALHSATNLRSITTKDRLSGANGRLGHFQRVLFTRAGQSTNAETSAAVDPSSTIEKPELNANIQELQQLYYGTSYAHALPVEEVLESLHVSSYHGLTSIQSTRRLAHFGPNKLQEAKKESLLQQILEQFDDRLVQVLVSVAFLSAVLASFENNAEAFIEPAVILMILLINAFVGIYQSSSAAESLDALKKLQAQTATVLRDSQWLTDVPVSALVPGDIIALKVGDRVPADARVIEVKSSSLYADEASLTGESTVVMKTVDAIEEVDATISSKSSIIFSGTIITSGSCLAVVIMTGEKTEMGKIDAGVQAAKVRTSARSVKRYLTID